MNPRWLPLLAALMQAACAGSGDTPEERAMAPWLARLDADGDGRVSGREYGDFAETAPPWDEVDTDRNGVLGAAELYALWLAQDPVTFDQQHPDRGTGRRRARDTRAGEPPPQLRTLTLLDFLDAELAHANAAPPGVAPGLREEVLAGAAPEDAPTQRLLLAYRDAYDRAGLRFPQGVLTEPPPAPPAP